MRSAHRRACLLGLGALVLASCGGDSDGNDAGTTADEGDPVTVASGDARLPSAELVDWVSYADAVVVVTITEETELPATEEEVERGEGYVPRDVTATVDEVTWSHPAASEVPESFTYTAAGWALVDGRKHPMVIEGAERVEVGRRYLMAVTRFDGVVAPTGPSAVIPFDDAGEVAPATADRDVPADTELVGLTADEVAARLANTPPDPVAEANRNLPAEDRYAKVLEAQPPAP